VALSDESNEDDIEIESIVSGDTEPVSAKSAGADAAQQEELTKAKNDYLYLRADFDNFRKSTIRERAELIKYGAERIFVELLEVLDNFERALQTELTPETIAVYQEGVELTRNEFKKTIEKFGVRQLECEKGAPFDPNLHEAISSEETDTVSPGHITRVYKTAYKLHDRIIRPAQVVVAKEPANS
jgi:molecular chaperone GrpE